MLVVWALWIVLVAAVAAHQTSAYHHATGVSLLERYEAGAQATGAFDPPGLSFRDGVAAFVAMALVIPALGIGIVRWVALPAAARAARALDNGEAGSRDVSSSAASRSEAASIWPPATSALNRDR